MAPSANDMEDPENQGGSSLPGSFKRINKLPETNDPTVREWNMYMNVSPDTHVILLRYPDKSGDRTGQKGVEKGVDNTPYIQQNKPLEFRIKPLSGLIEVDVPLMPHAGVFDKLKGIMYGEAIRRSKIMKERGGSYGIAGGFGLGGSFARAHTGSGRDPVNEEVDPSVGELLNDYDKAMENGHVLTKITLGGHINIWNETSPNLYVGHFQDANVFFTKVDALCVLRPQLVHLDALNDQKKSTLRMQAGTDTEENEAFHVNMTIKKSEGESTESVGDISEVAKLLKSMREEPWQRLFWIDSETQESKEKFADAFTPAEDSKPSQLTCNMTNEQWLDVISCPRTDPINTDLRAVKTGQEQADLSSTDTDENNEEGDELDPVHTRSDSQGEAGEDRLGGVVNI
ncbi:MAG: hypothetical protein Q9195_007846 [Heterodermia aff. obscurata]